MANKEILCRNYQLVENKKWTDKKSETYKMIFELNLISASQV